MSVAKARWDFVMRDGLRGATVVATKICGEFDETISSLGEREPQVRS